VYLHLFQFYARKPNKEKPVLCIVDLKKNFMCNSRSNLPTSHHHFTHPARMQKDATTHSQGYASSCIIIVIIIMITTQQVFFVSNITLSAPLYDFTIVK